MPGKGLTHGPLQNKKQTAVTTARSSGIPCAMVLRLIARSLPGDRAFLPLARKIIALRT
jgi:hypothetical protein